MNYQSKNPEVRALLDRPRWQEWIEFELEHIEKQMNANETVFSRPWYLSEFSKLAWEVEINKGGHEVERMLFFLSQQLDVKYHRYLHRGLTSSNVIDSCNHRRWNRLLVLLGHELANLRDPMEGREADSLEVPGMTHGRRAHRTSIRDRRYSCMYLSQEVAINSLELPDNVSGGPTGEGSQGGYHRQAWQRSKYLRLWGRIAEVCYNMEQLATDYRFYCSDLSEAVGVTGTLAPGVATTSSAMPGKVNPTVFERVCSVGYMVRTMCTAQMLQPPKWLDADLVHSALERETIDRIWDHTFWLVEEMTRLVSTTKLEVTREPVTLTSFDVLQDKLEQGFEYSKAREAAAKFPTG